MAKDWHGEPGALLALIAGDEAAALAILDEMLPNERAALVRNADRLSLLADDSQRCPRCRNVVEPGGSGTTSLGLRGPRENWHTPCLDADRAEKAPPEPKWGLSLAEHPDGPPQPGDVWNDGITNWTTRLDADGRIEFFEPGGPGFVPAHDVLKFRGGMKLISRNGWAPETSR